MLKRHFIPRAAFLLRQRKFGSRFPCKYISDGGYIFCCVLGSVCSRKNYILLPVYLLILLEGVTVNEARLNILFLKQFHQCLFFLDMPNKKKWK